jgi:type III secretory pathway component EscU
MPKHQVKREKKQRRGRPEIPGRRGVVKLEEAHIKRASELGEGNVAAGIRQALAR